MFKDRNPRKAFLKILAINYSWFYDPAQHRFLRSQNLNENWVLLPKKKLHSCQESKKLYCTSK